MATFEERELVDYTMKKLEKVLEPENFVIKDLNKFNIRIKRQEERIQRIFRKIENLESRLKILETEDTSE